MAMQNAQYPMFHGPPQHQLATQYIAPYSQPHPGHHSQPHYDAHASMGAYAQQDMPQHYHHPVPMGGHQMQHQMPQQAPPEQAPIKMIHPIKGTVINLPSNNNTAQDKAPPSDDFSKAPPHGAAPQAHAPAPAAAPTGAVAPEAPAAAPEGKKSCGCKRKNAHKDHKCSDSCTIFMGCNGECGLPDSKNKGRTGPSAGKTKGVRPQAAPLPKVPLAGAVGQPGGFSTAAPAAPSATTTPPAAPPAGQSPPVGGPPAGPTHAPLPSQPPRPPHDMHGGMPPHQVPDPHPHPQHPHPGHGHDASMMQQQFMQQHHMAHPGHMAGPMYPQQHPPMHPQQHHGVQPKRAIMAGAPQGYMGQQQFDPGMAHMPQQTQQTRSHALKITTPATRVNTYTYAQVCEVQNEVLQQLEEMKRSIKPLIQFTSKNGSLFKSNHARPKAKSNPISELRGRLNDSDPEKAHIKGILNKLTPEKYEPLKMLMYDCIKQADKKDENGKAKGITSQEIADLVYEDAVTVKEFTEQYAQLCQDLTKKQAEQNNQTIGKTPFRRALIMKCQSEYERSGPNAQSVSENSAADAEAARRAAIRANNNIHFVGELFKRQLVTEKIIVEHVLEQLLVKDFERLDDAKTEKVVQLFKTVGKDLDRAQKQQTKDAMDKYFKVLQDLRLRKGTTRIGFLLQELIEMRANNWTPKLEAVGDLPQKLDALDHALKVEQEQRSLHGGKAGWVAPASPSAETRIPDITVPYLLGEFAKGPISEQLEKRLLSLNETRTVLLRDVLFDAVTNSDKDKAEAVLNGLVGFLTGLNDTSEVKVTLLKKLFTSAGPKIYKNKNTRWEAFGAFLDGLAPRFSEFPEVAFGSEAVVACGMESKNVDLASLLPLMRCFQPRYLHTRILSFLVLHPTTTDARAAIEQLRKLQDDTDFKEESIHTALLLLDANKPAAEKTAELQNLGMDPGQVTLGVLIAEWVSCGGVQGKYTSWSEKSEEEQATLKEGFGQPDNKDMIMAEVEGLTQMATRVNPNTEEAISNLVRCCKDYLAEIKIISPDDL